MSTEEIWKPITGYEGVYSVSSQGRVRREIRGHGTWPGKILKPGSNKGYPTVVLCKNNVSKWFLVYNLVAQEFLGPRPAKYHTNHIDANKQNSAAENLEYITCLENNAHAKRLGLTNTGEKNGSAKITEEVVNFIRSYPVARGSQTKLAKMLGLSFQQISRIVNRGSWKHI